MSHRDQDCQFSFVPVRYAQGFRLVVVGWRKGTQRCLVVISYASFVYFLTSLVFPLTSSCTNFSLFVRLFVYLIEREARGDLVWAINLFCQGLEM